jgi:membrane fusion protein (multidrug efflux system)
VPVALEASHRGTIASYYSATATLEPDRQADIPARVKGVVLQVTAEEGDMVRHDQHLLRIQDREYRLRLQQTEAEVAKQQTLFQRVKRLHDQDLAASEEFSAAQMDLQNAEAAKDLAALEVSYTDVTAPFGGRITQRKVSAGQMVNPGATLFTLVDMSRLLARVHVPAREFRSIKTDQPVELLLDSNQERLQGRIDLVSPVVDPTSGTIKVTVEVKDYPPTARPGDFVEVRIVTASHPGAVLVPKSAVVSDKGERVVFVAADSTAERRVVEVGFQDDRNAEIVSGIREGEPVIIQGQRSLKHGQPIKVLEKTVFTDRTSR